MNQTNGNEYPKLSSGFISSIFEKKLMPASTLLIPKKEHFSFIAAGEKSRKTNLFLISQLQ